MCEDVMQEELMEGNIGQTMGIKKQTLRKKIFIDDDFGNRFSNTRSDSSWYIWSQTGVYR
jgi:hypothetical protein